MTGIFRGSTLAVLILAVGILGIPHNTSAQAAQGAIHLAVDATQAPQKILHIHEQIPVEAGPLTLYYPEWLPGEHMPDGPIIEVAGLQFTGGGNRIPWRRDLVEMYSFHLDIPEEIGRAHV